MKEKSAEYAGWILRKCIEESGMTQEEFAEKYFISKRQLSRWINTGINSLNTIESIADFFGLSVKCFVPD